MNAFCWHIDGMAPERNKGDGFGIMLSGLTCYAFGFGMPLTQEELDGINALRKNEHYTDEEAALELFETTKKPDLKESPFVVFFEYGKAKGYWGYKHIICQLEDCVDCLRYLFPGENGRKFKYDFLFEFDWSAGHSKLRTNGLNVSSANLGFGGKQPIMRDTTISDVKTELGDCPEATLQNGSVQVMYFVEGDDPPITDPDAPKHDIIIGGGEDER